MKEKIIYLLLAACMFPLAANALSLDLKKKYPFSVLTDDNGVLSETDLNSYLDGVKPPTEFPSGKNFIFTGNVFRVSMLL